MTSGNSVPSAPQGRAFLTEMLAGANRRSTSPYKCQAMVTRPLSGPTDQFIRALFRRGPISPR